MKRPAIKEKSVLQYVEYLESQLTSEDVEKKFFKGLKRQIGFLADEMLSEDFKVSFKDEDLIDRFLKIVEKSVPIAKGVEAFSKIAFPKEEAKKINTETADGYIK